VTRRRRRITCSVRGGRSCPLARYLHRILPDHQASQETRIRPPNQDTVMTCQRDQVNNPSMSHQKPGRASLTEQGQVMDQSTNSTRSPFPDGPDSDNNHPRNIPRQLGWQSFKLARDPAATNQKIFLCGTKLRTSRSFAQHIPADALYFTTPASSADLLRHDLPGYLILSRGAILHDLPSSQQLPTSPDATGWQ
jgi:hypothetical protein